MFLHIEKSISLGDRRLCLAERYSLHLDELICGLTASSRILGYLVRLRLAICPFAREQASDLNADFAHLLDQKKGGKKGKLPSVTANPSNRVPIKCLATKATKYINKDM